MVKSIIDKNLMSIVNLPKSEVRSLLKDVLIQRHPFVVVFSVVHFFFCTVFKTWFKFIPVTNALKGSDEILFLLLL